MDMLPKQLKNPVDLTTDTEEELEDEDQDELAEGEAGPEEDEAGSEDDSEEAAEEEADPARAPKAKGDPSEKMVSQSQVDRIVQDRIAKLERKHVKALEDVKVETRTEFARYAGANLPEADVKEALRFYAYMKANPRHSASINNFLSNNPWESHPKFDDKGGNDADLRAEFDRKLALRDTVGELRADPTFKKHEAKVREYAEDEGFDVDDPKDLKKAYKAWRGENARLLAANARLEGQREVASAKTKAKAAKLQGSAGPRGARAVDPRKLSDSEFLRKEGLSLFTDSE